MSKLGVEISIILATSAEEPTETLGSTDDSVLLLTRVSNAIVMNVGKDLDDLDIEKKLIIKNVTPFQRWGEITTWKRNRRFITISKKFIYTSC